MNYSLPTPTTKMKTEQLIKKWIEDLVANGFMQGWMGDKSAKFKKSQYDCIIKVLDGDIKIIGGNYRLLATLYSDYSNLKQYCKWKEEDLKSLLALFGFKKIEHVLALMNCDAAKRNECMDKGKLKEDVQFILTPIL